MKKAICLLLACVLTIGLLSACGGPSDTGTPASSTPEQVSMPEPTPTPTPEPTPAIETFVEEIPVVTAKLSDGPIFCNGDIKSFTLTHYSLETNERTDIFSYDFSNKYYLAIDPTDDGNFFHKQLFDSTVSRIAVGWHESSDNSRHVGWMDKYGTVTDVTNIVHPASSGFSGTTPADESPLFTSDDKLVFYDRNQELYCYYDPDTQSIVDTYESDLKPTENSFRGLDFNDHPTTHHFHVNEIEYNIDNNAAFDGTNGLARDYADCNGDVIFFEVEDHSISHFGPGLTELYYSKYAGPNSFYVSYDNIIAITPATEYWIRNMAYCNGRIVFTASRGTEMSLFSFGYENKQATSDPEFVTNIDNSWGNLFFWIENDSPVQSLYGATETIEKTYQDLPGFSIEGKWKNIGKGTFGQAQSGAIIAFDGTNCNFFSPEDTYAISKDGRYYKLDCTSLLSTVTIILTVKTIDENNIDVFYGDTVVELTRAD